MEENNGPGEHAFIGIVIGVSVAWLLVLALHEDGRNLNVAERSICLLVMAAFGLVAALLLRRGRQRGSRLD